MNILEISKNYNTQAKCIAKLEKLRWGKSVMCPYCDSKRNRAVKSEAGRHSCKSCKRSFTVLIDTIFESSRLPLPQWFMIIGLVLNAKSGLAAKEIQRNIGCTYKTAYYVAMRIRIGMLMPNTKLHGIIEMDESYFGGKARKAHKISDSDTSIGGETITLKRGRGTNKISVAGMVQRKGMVKTQVMEKLTKRNLLAMLKHYASKDNSILVTDGFKSYKELETYIDRLEINHSKSFSKGIVHVNTIENFWGSIKNGVKGSYRAISKKYLPFYLVEFEWKFNHRNFRGNQLDEYLKKAVTHQKELEYWKAESTEQVKDIAYEKQKE
ncbi:MAG: IS1595 family transposase [Bacteroidia bacterium]|nr:IS1595 family transposase [Bacteroidia bacterium]